MQNNGYISAQNQTHNNMSKESMRLVQVLKQEAKAQNIHYIRLALRIREKSNYFEKVFTCNGEPSLSTFANLARSLGYRIELVKDATIKETFKPETPDPIPGVNFSEFIKPAPTDIMTKNLMLNLSAPERMVILNKAYKKGIKR